MVGCSRMYILVYESVTGPRRRQPWATGQAAGTSRAGQSAGRAPSATAATPHARPSCLRRRRRAQHHASLHAYMSAPAHPVCLAGAVRCARKRTSHAACPAPPLPGAPFCVPPGGGASPRAQPRGALRRKGIWTQAGAPPPPAERRWHRTVPLPLFAHHRSPPSPTVVAPRHHDNTTTDPHHLLHRPIAPPPSPHQQRRDAHAVVQAARLHDVLRVGALHTTTATDHHRAGPRAGRHGRAGKRRAWEVRRLRACSGRAAWAGGARMCVPTPQSCLGCGTCRRVHITPVPATHHQPTDQTRPERGGGTP